MEEVVKWIDQGQERAIGALTEFLRIPSVSTDSERREDMKRASEFLADLVRNAGIENVEIIPTAGHPIVYGEKFGVAGAPTLLIYGHYDVQPIGDLAKWSSSPFEPEIRDGKIVLAPMGPLSSRRLAGHTTSPAVVDWDANGVPDLLVGAEDGFFYYLKNPLAE